MNKYFADGINFDFHQAFSTFSAAIAAATAATIAADRGQPSFASIWSEEDNEFCAVVSESVVFLCQDDAHNL